MKHPAPFVWVDADGRGRAQHVYFRFEAELSEIPTKALLNCFADTHYHLRVNGVFLAYGPERFYPEYPDYDTHDIASYLKPGRNAICVHVYQPGMATFHNLYNRGGFTAWGEIEAGGKTVSLATPGDWKTRRAPGYDSTTPKYSFTSAPVIDYDARDGEMTWAAADFEMGPEWQTPTEIEQQDSWGELSPRTIPPLEYCEELPRQLLSAHEHLNDEVIYSFRHLNFDRPQDQVFRRRRLLAYTWIHSPHPQQVRAGTYWGEHELNGRPVVQEIEKNGRRDAVLDLNEGWNFFLVSYGLVAQNWDFFLALPRNAELTLSAEKELTGESPVFAVSQDFDPEDSFWHEFDEKSHHHPPEIPGGWTMRAMPYMPVTASRNLAWQHFGPDLGIEPARVSDLTARMGRDTSFNFDMGELVLGRIFIEVEAPEGTVLDIGFTEDYGEDRPKYYKNVQVHPAERFVAAGEGVERFESFVPRGFRYLQIGVQKHNMAVTVKRIGIVTQLYPHVQKAHFECSDPVFNQLWPMGFRTLRVCSEDVYTDCPGRERTLYAGDALPEFATALVTSGDTLLMKRCLDIFLQSQSETSDWQQSMAPMERVREPLFDYPILTLYGIEWHTRATGDLEFAKYAWPRLKRLMNKAESLLNEQNLITSMFRPFIDHVGIDRTGISGPLSSLFSTACKKTANLARLVGEPDLAPHWEQLAETVAEAVRAHFWDERRGAFGDNLIDGKRSGKYHPIASYWALYHGIATPEQAQRVLEYFEEVFAQDDGSNPEPFGGPYCNFYLLGGLYRYGFRAFAEKYIRRYWGRMAYADSSTMWEHFETSKSLAHAWSTAPNYYFITRVLGIRYGVPETEGLDQLVIAPEAETLNYASGKTPHPLGEVSVTWRVHGERFEIDIEAPEGVAWTLAPRGRLAELELVVNGERK